MLIFLVTKFTSPSNSSSICLYEYDWETIHISLKKRNQNNLSPKLVWAKAEAIWTFFSKSRLKSSADENYTLFKKNITLITNCFFLISFKPIKYSHLFFSKIVAQLYFVFLVKKRPKKRSFVFR